MEHHFYKLPDSAWVVCGGGRLEIEYSGLLRQYPSVYWSIFDVFHDFMSNVKEYAYDSSWSYLNVIHTVLEPWSQCEEWLFLLCVNQGKNYFIQKSPPDIGIQ